MGASGEDLAAAWYQAAGYQILARNWRCRDGEIDIVCSRARSIVFCEVKTRTTAAFGHPAEAVTPAKQRKLRLLAGRWLSEADLGYKPAEIRFDVAAVLGGELDVIEGAF